jgi:PPP family 3-phenylpropionic acid transporter
LRRCQPVTSRIGFFQPYLPLWLKELGLGIFRHQCAYLTSLHALSCCALRLGLVSDHTGEREAAARQRHGGADRHFGLWINSGTGAGGGAAGRHTASMMPLSEAAMAHLNSHNGVFDARRYRQVRLFGRVSGHRVCRRGRVRV